MTAVSIYSDKIFRVLSILDTVRFQQLKKNCCMYISRKIYCAESQIRNTPCKSYLLKSKSKLT